MSTTISAEGDKEQPLKKNSRKSFTENLNEVNKSWGILEELGQNKFEIPLKSRAENIDSLEKNIVASAKNDAEVIKRLEASTKESVNSGFQEIHRIKQQEALLTTSNTSTNVPKVADPAPVAKVSEAVEKSVVSEVAAVTKSVLEVGDVSLMKHEPVNKAVTENIKTDKNLFFRFVMKGLAQLYVDKTTTIFNPVVFIAKNFNALMQTILLLGVPAAITWFLFNKVENLHNLFSNVSTTLYWFYALMFYMASLFLCLTLRVIGSGVWVMIGKSMTEVAEKASADVK